MKTISELHRVKCVNRTRLPEGSADEFEPGGSEVPRASTASERVAQRWAPAVVWRTRGTFCRCSVRKIVLSWLRSEDSVA